MRCLPEHYHAAALERFTDATLLRRAGNWALAMYVAGLSVECMVRAHIPPRAKFDERHGVFELFQATEWPVTDRQRRVLSADLNDVRLLWNNAYRFADEQRVKSHLKSLKLHLGRELHRDADFLKFRCIQLEDTANRIIGLGRITWQKNP